MRRLSSFTLIELLIVVAIIGILAAIAVPNFLQAQIRAKVASTYANLRATQSAINLYILDCGRAIYRTAPNDPIPRGRPGQPQPDPDLLAISSRYRTGSCYQYHYLTSPVSYISSYEPCVDPLERHELLQQLPITDRKFCFSYEPVHARINILNFVSSSGKKITVAHDTNYVLSSAGPSGNGPKGLGMYNNGTLWEELVFSPYSASNGLISSGAIVATDSGIFGQ